VDFNSGTFTLNPGAALNGTGLYKISSSGTLSANEDITVQNFDLTGTLSGRGIVTVGNNLNWSAGSMQGTGRTLIAGGATLNLTGAAGVTLNPRTLENAGTVLCFCTGDFVANNAVITNRAGGLFDVQTNFNFRELFSPCRFDNAGTFRKRIAPGTNTFTAGFSFNNYGALDLQSGTLLCLDTLLNNGTVTLASGATNRLTGGGSATGTFTVPLSAVVDFNGGTFNLNAGALLSGTGSYKVSGTASLNANTDVAVQNLDLSSTLGGSAVVTVSNTMTWAGGTMAGTGRTLIAPGAVMNITGSVSGTLNPRTLENAGTVNCLGTADFIGNGAVVTNRSGALVDVQSDLRFRELLAGCRFDNAGMFRKRNSTGTNIFTSAFAFNNYGSVELRGGILLANGAYTSATGSSLACVIGGTAPGTGFAQLQIAGAITLNGGLSVGLTNNYVPATNDSFAVVTAGTRTGAFTGFSYPSNQVTMVLSNTPTSVIVRVTGVTAPPPAPLLLTPLLSGTNVLLSWAAVSNILYRLEFNPDLTPSNWTALPGDVLSTSTNASKLDPLTPSNRFYRVRVLP
jgi:hypothetical protein